MCFGVFISLCYSTLYEPKANCFVGAALAGLGGGRRRLQRDQRVAIRFPPGLLPAGTAHSKRPESPRTSRGHELARPFGASQPSRWRLIGRNLAVAKRREHSSTRLNPDRSIRFVLRIPRADSLHPGIVAPVA